MGAALLTPGRKVDRYIVEGELGVGGMATVYRVRHETLGSIHALKVLKMHGEGVRERLVQEGRVQATLRHPNIVEVTDVIDVDGAPGLVMEFIDGPSLDQWLRNREPDLAGSERIFRGILAGVLRAHKAGLVHRDLKPGNVLLAQGDEGIVPKVTDFGLAKIVSDVEGGPASQTRSGVAMGTPAYMAPEQVRDTKSVDKRADIFALGCIFYEMIVGEAPFCRPDVLQTFQALASGRYEPPERFNPNLPVRVSTTIACCLQIDREKRPEDCVHVRRLLDGEAPSVVLGRSPSSPVVAPSLEPTPTAVPPPASLPPPLAPVPSRPAASNETQAALAHDSLFDDPQPQVRRFGWAMAAVAVVGVLVILGLGAAAALWFGTHEDPGVPRLIPTVQGRPEPEPQGVSANSHGATDAGAGEGSAVASAEPPVGSVTSGDGGPSASAPEIVATRAGDAEPKAEPKPEPKTEAKEATVPPKVEAKVEPKVEAEPSAPKEEPKAEAGSAGNGTVRLSGDATSVTLVGGAGTFGPGSVPAGDYRVKADFPGKGVVSAGKVQVVAGQSVTLDCSSAFQICRAK